MQIIRWKKVKVLFFGGSLEVYSLLDSSRTERSVQKPMTLQPVSPSSFRNIKANFSIFHLNINSIFNKLIDFHSIICKHKFDFISLNETKLDSSVPDSFYTNEMYNIYWRDIGFGRGGGVMILIKKSYKILHTHISDSFEVIFVVIEALHSSLHFICCDKSPSSDDTEFLEYVEALVISIYLNDSIFIIGDLNMDLLSINGRSLQEFMSRFSFENFSTEPTRTASRIFKATNLIYFRQLYSMLFFIIEN
jgi:exonuclease III